MEGLAGFTGFEWVAFQMRGKSSNETRYCSHHSSLVTQGDRISLRGLENVALGVLQEQPQRISHYIALEATKHVDCIQHVGGQSGYGAQCWQITAALARKECAGGFQRMVQ